MDVAVTFTTASCVDIERKWTTSCVGTLTQEQVFSEEINLPLIFFMFLSYLFHMQMF